MNTAASPLSEWLTQLESFSPHEIELGLDRVTVVLERMDLRPPRRVLHVGGTNGKGSSVAMLQSILLANGNPMTETYRGNIRRFGDSGPLIIRLSYDGVGREMIDMWTDRLAEEISSWEDIRNVETKPIDLSQRYASAMLRAAVLNSGGSRGRSLRRRWSSSSSRS